MDHIGDGPDAVERIEAVERLRRIRHADRHAVPRADACGVEREGGAVDARQKIAVARSAAHELIGGQIRAFPRGLRDELVDGQARIIQRAGNRTVIIQPRCFCRDRHRLAS